MKEAYEGVITPRSQTSGPRQELEEEERASTGLVPPPFRFDSRHPAPQRPSMAGIGGLVGAAEVVTKFVLPPRSLADYLLGSIVFHTALNAVFAIGRQFLDFAGGAKEKIAAVETFLNR